MSSQISLALIVLTYNEAVNLPYCLKSVQDVAREIFIVDSGSTDGTLEIAHQFTDQVIVHPFVNQAQQFNWAIENLKIRSEWILRLDADEMLSPELSEELGSVLPNLPEVISGLYIKLKMYFLGRWIRHGSYYPLWLLRIFRYGRAYYEDKWMDERIVIHDGQTENLKNDIIHLDRKGLGHWMIKHHNYAQRELHNLLDHGYGNTGHVVQPSLTGNQAERRRWFKQNVYNRLPLFTRAFIYFAYRYFLRLGFLDGPEGLIYHFLQSFWYRFYIDALIWEARYLKKGESNQMS